VSYSPAGTLLAERMFEAIDRNAWQEAHQLAQQLHQMHPEQAATLTNLASVKQALGEPPEVIRQLYEQAHAQAPDYLFARCGLAVCLAGEGRIDEARALLANLLERDTWHYNEYRSFLMAQRAMALAVGELHSVEQINRSLNELRQRFDS
jgi:thioredoxin-like negative regulator of GroEL